VGGLTAVIGSALIARTGTPAARFAALGLVLVVMSWLALAHARRARQRNRLERVLLQIVKPSDPVAAERSARALRLLAHTETDAHYGSPELARQFVDETLKSIPLTAIEKRARRFAWLMDGLVVLALVASFATAVGAGRSVVEGVDVALAYRGRAPVKMLWLDVTGVSAQPPGYSRITEHSILFGSHVSELVGTTVSVRGVRARPGVDLVLTDGQHATEFVETGDGEVVAHWALLRSVQLKIAGRFGGTLIEQEDTILVDAEPDETPEVVLENEGQTVRLGRVSRVELNYHARDDYGLRQIDLVLRTTEREERRTLMRLDGQQRQQSGAYGLNVDDPFLREVHLPTLVRVEARDDNNLIANNWGISGWIKLEPPTPGEPEAERIEVLHQVHSKLVTWLADRVTSSNGADLARDREVALGALAQSQTEEHELWRWPTQVGLLLGALNEKLTQISAGGEQELSVLQEATLALDSVILELSQRDARNVSRTLASLADEVALGARQASSTEFQERGERRLDDALLSLPRGGRALGTLGDLGSDLASVVRATLVRIERARAAHDYTHVQLAAEYLSARLRRPEPSAGSAPTGGVETGAGRGQGSSRQRAASSNAAQRIERLLMELLQLRQEHRSGLELLERTVSASGPDTSAKDAMSSGDSEEAARLRRAAESLPYLGAEPDSALSSQVVAREQALGAAESIQRNRTGDALERVRAARDAVAEALLRSRREHRVTEIDQKGLRLLDEELIRQARILEQAVDRERKETGRRAADQLPEQVGAERQLAKRERRDDAVIPEGLRRDLEHAAGFMDLASDALENKDGTQALEQERRAQELLDHVDAQRPSRTAERDKENGQAKPSTSSNQGTVTPTGDPEAAARFRSRVQQGLSTQTPTGELGSAIRRYAEGLLR
jgi:hypothetical protein